MKSTKHAKLGSAAAVLFALAIASAGLGCESILGLTPGKGLCEGVICPQKHFQCGLPSICDEGTGECLFPVAMDKTPCDDGDPCTTGDACQGGACMPGAPKLCAAQDRCHLTGVCDKVTGMCSTPNALDDTDCAEADECASSGKCKGGTCVLVPIADADGKPCNLGDTCTQAGTCANGKCAGGTVFEDGAMCNDGSACSMGDKCTSGVCNPNADRSWARWDLASKYPSQRFEATDTVVYDRLTHLTWQRVALPELYSWDQAVEYCKGLNLPGYPKGWRLPKRMELASIVDYKQQGVAIDTGFFQGQNPAVHFWSSSLVAGMPGNVWFITFSVGYIGMDETKVSKRVRCVR